MQFLAFYRPAEISDAPPSPEHMEQMNRLIEAQTRSGHLLATGGFLPSGAGLRVRLADGEFTARDGAGPGSDVLGGGFGLLQARSQEEMMDLIKQFLTVAGDGECMIRVLIDGPPARSTIRDSGEGHRIAVRQEAATIQDGWMTEGASVQVPARRARSFDPWLDEETSVYH
jgi:hypothetical protein